jgi:hypothetical protein
VSQPEEQPPKPSDASSGDDEIAPTPFDNPFFLPVVLVGMTLWLGYDGFLNQEFISSHTGDEAWVVGFNRWGALVIGLLAAWFTFRAFRERAASRSDRK